MNKLERIHYSRSEELQFQNIADVNADNFKPRGLWYSIGDAWLAWVISEQPDWLGAYPYIYRPKLNHERILTLPGEVAELRSFLAKYGVDFGPLGFMSFKQIDWNAVAEDYAGIEFYPYRRNLMFNFYSDDEESRLTHDEVFSLTFYSGVDVPSGCIWHEDGILDFGEPERQNIETIQAKALEAKRRWEQDLYGDDDDDEEDEVSSSL